MRTSRVCPTVKTNKDIMNTKDKVVEFKQAKYATAAELDENYNFLERLVETKQVKKIYYEGNNYYEVEAVKRCAKDLRTIPPGYVRAVDHAILLGSDSRTASKLCGQRGAQSKKVQVGTSKPAWFAHKGWLEAEVSKILKSKPSKATVTKVAKAVTVSNPEAAILALQKEVANLRELFQASGITPPKMEMPKKGIITDADARKAGFEPIQDIVDAFDIPRGTLSSWYTRKQVRSLKIDNRVYLHLDDVHARTEQLPGNRAKLGGLIKTNGHPAKPHDITITWDS